MTTENFKVEWTALPEGEEIPDVVSWLYLHPQSRGARRNYRLICETIVSRLILGRGFNILPIKEDEAALFSVMLKNESTGEHELFYVTPQLIIEVVGDALAYREFYLDEERKTPRVWWKPWTWFRGRRKAQPNA